jgi:hypothetical protein
MIEFFTSGGYGPELLKIMSDALESAWRKAPGAPWDSEFARLIMASAIIQQVDAGVCAHEVLVDSAITALATAKDLSGGGLETPRRIRGGIC